MKSKLFLFLTPLFLALSIHAAPPLISYSGQVSVDGQPYTGTGLFKFAFVDANGQFSYWSHDGTSSAGSEPTGQVSVPVSAGLYSVMLGDTALTGMSAIAESIFANHNDVHLRIWFSDGQGFEQLTPDRRFASVPYSLGANGTSTANLVSTGSGSSAGDNNSSTTNIHNYNFGGRSGWVMPASSPMGRTIHPPPSFCSVGTPQKLLPMWPINPAVWNMPLMPTPFPCPVGKTPCFPNNPPSSARAPSA